jgi:hypothetical protein
MLVGTVARIERSVFGGRAWRGEWLSRELWCGDAGFLLLKQSTPGQHFQ